MNERDKKVVREKRSREQKIREAMTKPQTPFVSSHGMTPQQIRKTLNKKPETKPKHVIRQAIKRPISQQNRPAKAKRSETVNPMKLWDAPTVSSRNAVEYPTPSWYYMNREVDVSVIVPVYKSSEVLVDLIGSWTFDHDGLTTELIFVDDNSPTNDKDVIIREWGRKRRELADNNTGVGRIYHNSENQGFGMTCNTGAENAKGKYLIFLNADTRVTHNWIKPMVRMLRKDDVGIVGNLQIKDGGSFDGTIDGAGSQWTWEYQTFDHIGRHIYNHKRITRPFTLNNCPRDILEPAEREMVTGCCFAIRADLFKSIGGLNPNYRIGYWEDSELCMTIKEKGYKVMFQPNSKIYHKLGHTSSGGHKHDKTNRDYFFNKWVHSGRIDKIVEDKREFVPEVKSILLKRQAAHGDVLVAAAVAPALKKKYPNCKIFFNTDCKEVLDGNPWIDKIVEDSDVSERLFRVYYNLDMAYEYRPFTNILEAYADLVGVPVADCQSFLLNSPIGGLPDNYAVIHAGKTSWVGRDWSSYKFDIISKNFTSRGIPVVCVGRGGDHKITCDLDLRNKTTINQLAYVINKCRIFVGIDSFPMHVAQTFGKPGVCFFGSIDPLSRIYNPNMTGVKSSSLECLGCHHRKPAPSVVTDSCETGTLDCVNFVSVKNMWDKIEEVLVNGK